MGKSQLLKWSVVLADSVICAQRPISELVNQSPHCQMIQLSPTHFSSHLIKQISISISVTSPSSSLKGYGLSRKANTRNSLGFLSHQELP